MVPAVKCAGGELPTVLDGQPRSIAHRGPASPVKWLRPLAILAGALIVVGLVWEVGPSTLVAELRKLSWRLPLILLPQIVTNLFKTEGWRYAFPRRRPRFGLLFPIRLAGEAVNETTPTGTMGGDALKAFLLVRAGAGVPVEEGLVSVVVAKSALVASLAAFIACTVGVAWALGGTTPAMLSLLALLALYMALSTAGFVWAQVRGMFRMGGRALKWMGLGDRVAAGADRLDSDLRWYYRERRGAVMAVGALSLVGWATGALETWLMLVLLDSPVSLMTALVIEAGATGVRAVGFLIPGSIGILEGGIVGIFAMLGLGSSTGLAFSVARRFREGVWILLGYTCLAVMRGPKAPAAGTDSAATDRASPPDPVVAAIPSESRARPDAPRDPVRSC
jgi:glycosyltransferase 2 family protein